MLVVIGIIGLLAGMLTTAVIYARNLSRRVQCQQNLNHIGQTVSMLVLSNSGLYPIGPPVNSITQPGSGLSNAYPMPQASDINPLVPNNSGFPWWARVFEQWEDMGLLFATTEVNNDPSTRSYLITGAVDANFNPNGHVLNPQLPLTLSAFHCPMGGALDGSSANHSNPLDPNNWSVTNLFNSISYGINFDVKDAGPLAINTSPQPRPYCASSWTGIPSQDPYSQDFPNNLNTADKYPDQYRATEIQNPSQFIVISEADTQDPIPTNWTGGRIWMGDTSGNGTGYERIPGDSPPGHAPNYAPNPNYTPHGGGIVGRHGGYANVLFADWHVESIEVAPGQTVATRNVNYDTPLWTLPGK